MRQVYLAGGITGLSKGEAEDWRNEAKEWFGSLKDAVEHILANYYTDFI